MRSAHELHERTVELDALARLIDGAARGDGGVVVVEGVAGIGKSTLLAAAAERAAARGFAVRTARGGELEQNLAYGVVRQLLAPEVRAGADPASAAAWGAGPGAPGDRFAVDNRLYYARLGVEAAAEMLVAGAALTPAMSESFLLSAMLSTAQRQDDAYVRSLHDLLAMAPPWTGPGHHGQLAALVGAGIDETYREWWPRITAPVLVVSFEHDDRFPPGNGAAMAAAIPGARHAVVEGAAHGGPLTHGPQIAELLLGFLAEQRAGAVRVTGNE